jgi:hypothetical protein
MIVCVFTDEPMLTLDAAIAELVHADFGAFCQLTRAFLLLSYNPGTKSYPVVPLRVN